MPAPGLGSFQEGISGRVMQCLSQSRHCCTAQNQLDPSVLRQPEAKLNLASSSLQIRKLIKIISFLLLFGS